MKRSAVVENARHITGAPQAGLSVEVAIFYARITDRERDAVNHLAYGPTSSDAPPSPPSMERALSYLQALFASRRGRTVQTKGITPHCPIPAARGLPHG